MDAGASLRLLDASERSCDFVFGARLFEYGCRCIFQARRAFRLFFDMLSTTWITYYCPPSRPFNVPPVSRIIAWILLWTHLSDLWTVVLHIWVHLIGTSTLIWYALNSNLYIICFQRSRPVDVPPVSRIIAWILLWTHLSDLWTVLCHAVISVYYAFGCTHLLGTSTLFCYAPTALAKHFDYSFDLCWMLIGATEI